MARKTVSLVGSSFNDLIKAYDYARQLHRGGSLDDLYGYDKQYKIYGLNGNDRLYGYQYNDWLYGGNGQDHLYGSYGDDRLYGHKGNDRLKGERGDDKLFGGKGNDKLYGGHGRDTLKGDKGKDKLFGDKGKDKLFGGKHNDKLFGGKHNDILDGGKHNDVLKGQHGQDLLKGGDGHDRLYGGKHNDKIFGGEGNDSLYGEAHRDVLKGGAGRDKLYGGDGDDTLYGDKDNDMLYGDKGNDTLFGGEGEDTLDGGLGKDTLYGGSGDDVLIGRGDSDTLDGGSGNDIITYHRNLIAVAINLNLIEQANGDILKNIENVTGSQFADVLIGNDEKNILNGLGGDDIFYGSLGNDVIDGGAGLDTMSYEYINQAIHITLIGNGIKTKHSSDTILNIEKVIGSRFNDTLVGNEKANHLFGSAGEDYIEGGDGHDILQGGDDKDEIHGGQGNDELTGGAGADSLYGGDENDTIYGGLGDDYIYGDGIDESGNDVIYGNDGADTIEGRAGNDAIFGGSGDDMLDGGAGHDRIYGGDAIASLDSGQDTIRGRAGNDTIYAGDGDDAIDGGEGDDTIYGDAGDDNIDGGLGNDFIDGGAGDDEIEGGDGNDDIYGRDGNDIINGNAGDDTIYAGAGDDIVNGGLGRNVLYGGEGYDILSFADVTEDLIIDISVIGSDVEVLGNIISGFESISGGQGHDIITGDDNANIIAGDGGDDTLWGHAGDDQLYGNRGSDALNGGEGADNLYGGEGNDILNGDNGDDYIEGGLGNNTIDGGLGDDTLSYQHAIGGINMETGAADSFGFLLLEHGSGIDKYKNIKHFIGSEHSDLLIGDEQYNTIDGLAGDDEIYGGSGHDKLIGGLGEDIIRGEGGRDDIEGGEGNDVILGGSSNDTISGGEGDDIIDGGEDDDTIDGGKGNDELYGGTGNDTIFGGDGDDTIYAGAGYDDVFGGDGKDLFVIHDQFDAIGDFNSEDDTIDLSALMHDGLSFNGNAGLEGFGERSYAYTFKDNNETSIDFDTDGDGASDFNFVLKGHVHLKEDDFIFDTKTITYGRGDTIIGGYGGGEVRGDDGNDIIIADEDSFDKDSYAGLVTWFDAQDIDGNPLTDNPETGDRVLTWVDKAEVSNTASYATGYHSYGATYANEVDGMLAPSLYFDGSSSYAIRHAMSQITGRFYTVVSLDVHREQSPNDINILLGSGNADNGEGFHYGYRLGNQLSLDQYADGDFDVYTGQVPTIGYNTGSIATHGKVVATQLATISAIRVYQHGGNGQYIEAIATSGGSDLDISTPDLYAGAAQRHYIVHSYNALLGGSYDHTASDVRAGKYSYANPSFKGNLAEILFFNRGISATELDKLQHYLAIHNGVTGYTTLGTEQEADYLYGSTGADIFKWTNQSFTGLTDATRDVIMDFNRGEYDKIDISELSPKGFLFLGLKVDGNFEQPYTSKQPVVFYTHEVDASGNLFTLLHIDRTGDKKIDNQIKLHGKHYYLTKDDFIDLADEIEITGTDGDDVLKGFYTNDTIVAGEGSDFVEGEDGDDTIYLDRRGKIARDDDSIDIVAGGRGQDAFVFSKNEFVGDGYKTTEDVILDFEQGIDKIDIRDLAPNSFFNGQEGFLVQAKPLMALPSSMSFYGYNEGNEVRSSFYYEKDGNDTLIYIDKHQELQRIPVKVGFNPITPGPVRYDQADADGRADHIIRLKGFDKELTKDDFLFSRYIGNEENNNFDLSLYYDKSAKYIEGRGGNDTLIAKESGAQWDVMLGGDGDDFIDGRYGNDTLDGGSGHDTLIGGAGADTLKGGEGDDLIYLDGNDSTAYGGDGVDVAEGGGGRDTFIFGKNGFTGTDLNNPNQDVILDFTQGEDQIDISKLIKDGFFMNDFGFAASRGLNISSFYYSQDDTDTLLHIDSNGDNIDDATIRLQEFIEELSVDDFILEYDSKATDGADVLKAESFTGLQMYGLSGGDYLIGDDNNNIIYPDYPANEAIFQGKMGSEEEDKLLDVIYGGKGADLFTWTTRSESGMTKQTMDMVMDFSQEEGDRLDITGLVDKIIETNYGYFSDEHAVFSGLVEDLTLETGLTVSYAKEYDEHDNSQVNATIVTIAVDDNAQQQIYLVGEHDLTVDDVLL